MAKTQKEKTEKESSKVRLARNLGFFAALSVGVGTMIGAGIFVLPGIVASMAGPAVLLSFAVCGFIAVLIALCMAELSTGMPYAGGGYLFMVRAFGPLVGTIMGWSLWLSLVFASAFYMIGFGHYLSDALGTSPTVVALIVTALLGLLNFIGARETGGTQTVIVGILLFILAAFVARSIFEVDLAKLTPFIPSEKGFAGILITLPILFITFLGFAEISAISEEIRNPKRNLPLAQVSSVVIVTVLYCAVVFCMLGLRNYSDPNMAQETVLMDLARQLMGNGGYIIVLFGGILATVSSANASVLAASRVNFAMGRDQLMPEWLNQIHSRFKTPYRSIATTTGLTMLLIFLLGRHLELLAEVAGFLSLVLYSLITLACIIMRYAKLDWYKPSFRTPGYPMVPLMGLFGCLFVIVNTSRVSLLIGNLIIAASFVWYMLFLRRGTQLVGASNVLWKDKVMKPLMVRAKEYLATRPEDVPVILVPLANPDTEYSLLMLSTALAKKHKAQLQLIHVVDVPGQTPLEAGGLEYEKQRWEEKTLLETASYHAAEQGVRARATAIVARSVSSAILSVAEMEQPEYIIMGWKGTVRISRTGRTNVADVLKIARGNVLVLKDRGLPDVKRIIVPVSGGSHAQLGLKLAQVLAEEWNASLIALNVRVGRGPSAARSEFDKQSIQLFQDKAKEFVKDTLDAVGVSAEVDVIIDTDIARAIARSAQKNDLIVIGASEEWAFRRRLFGSIPDRVADQAEGSVLMVRSK
ncbi:MAG: amino acid permease [Candidatus Aminicenantes bacterium]|jgi:amino acid transporter/nucleotide-binding universal stress UspA family protein